MAVPSCTARRAIDIRFQQQHSQHCTEPWPHSQWACLPCFCACLSVSIHRLLYVLLGCYDLFLLTRYCWTECTSAESTNLKLGLREKIGVHDLNRVILKHIITRVQCTIHITIIIIVIKGIVPGRIGGGKRVCVCEGFESE